MKKKNRHDIGRLVLGTIIIIGIIIIVLLTVPMKYIQLVIEPLVYSIVFIIVLYLLIWLGIKLYDYIEHRIEQEKMKSRYWDAASVSDICSKFEKTTQIRKYYKQHPEEFINDEKKHAQKAYANYILYERDFITKRVFAYDYEGMLYEIYAPFAKPYKNGWIATPLDKDFVINRIAEIERKTKNEAEGIFSQLYVKGLLHITKISEEVDGEIVIKKQLVLDNMLDSLKPYDGLKFNTWSIVSDKDMNLSKWMEYHDYKRK